MLTFDSVRVSPARVAGIEDLGGLQQLGRELVATERLTAFELSTVREGGSQVLVRIGETLHEAETPGMDACAENNGVWSFGLGDGQTLLGRLRVRLAGAPDHALVNELQQLSQLLYFSVRRVVDRERMVELERRIEYLSEQARHADHLKEEFLSNLSHELRTPLTAILGFAEILTERPELADASLECVTRIRDNGAKLLQLLNRLITLAKSEADRVNVMLGWVNVADIVHEAVRTFRPQAESKGLTVNTRIDQVPPVETDGRLLREVLDCLLENAVKFTDFGEIFVSARYRGSELLLEISDTGRGIDNGDMPFVFNAFWQGDGSMTRAVGGNGIGLALASRLLNRLGGRIHVDSHPGRGSTFTVTLTRQMAVRPLRPSRAVDAQQFALDF